MAAQGGISLHPGYPDRSISPEWLFILVILIKSQYKILKPFSDAFKWKPYKWGSCPYVMSALEWQTWMFIHMKTLLHCKTLLNGFRISASDSINSLLEILFIQSPISNFSLLFPVFKGGKHYFGLFQIRLGAVRTSEALVVLYPHSWCGHLQASWAVRDAAPRPCGIWIRRQQIPSKTYPIF